MWKFVVIDWIDWVWKATQTSLLTQKLFEKNFQASNISFPSYWQPSAWHIERFLNWDFWPLDQIDPYIASSFYTLDRLAQKEKLEKMIQQNDYVISDRFSTSSFVHRWSLYLDKNQETEMKKFFDWLYDFEFVKGKLPVPDKVIFLSLGIENIKKNLVRKMQQDNDKRLYISWNMKLDLAESDLKHLENSLYLWAKILPQYFENYEIVFCENEKGVQLTPQQISEIILSKIV